MELFLLLCFKSINFFHLALLYRITGMFMEPYPGTDRYDLKLPLSGGNYIIAVYFDYFPHSNSSSFIDDKFL